MKENQFLVDLGDLKLTTQQRNSINKSIQIAASIELAKMEFKEKPSLLEVNNGKLNLKVPKGFGAIKPPVLNGMIMITRKPIGMWEKLTVVQLTELRNQSSK
jgi:hypothetical protein